MKNAKSSPRSLAGLAPFLGPYRLQIAMAALFLVMAAVTTLVFPIALRGLIDAGLAPTAPGDQVMALREHFLALFGVAIALGLLSAARFYTVSWLGERITADVRTHICATSSKNLPGSAGASGGVMCRAERPAAAGGSAANRACSAW